MLFIRGESHAIALFVCQGALLFSIGAFLFSLIANSCSCPSLHPLTLTGLSSNPICCLWLHTVKHLLPLVPSLPFSELQAALPETDLPSPVAVLAAFLPTLVSPGPISRPIPGTPEVTPLSERYANCPSQQ